MDCRRCFASPAAPIAAIAAEKANHKGQGKPRQQHLQTMGLMNARHGTTPLHSRVDVGDE
jgi:hypothetical protein